jgi:hypothetical protein
MRGTSLTWIGLDSIGLSLATVLLAAPTTSRADDAPPLVVAGPTAAPTPPPPPPQQKELVDKEWYGWKLLILHGAADTVATAGFALTEVDPIAGSVIGGIGLAARLFGGLGLHVEHKNYLVGVFLVLTNLGLPTLGTVATYEALADRSGPKPEIFLGLAAGLIGASAFDVSLAWSHLLGESRPSVSVGPGTVAATLQF